MSITCEEFVRERKSTETRDNMRSYTRVFMVNTGDTTYNPRSILLIPNLPQRWAAHPDDPFALVQERNAEQTIDQYNWRVTITYATLKSAQKAEDNPLEQWPEISMRFQDYQIVQDRDQNGAAILTSSLEPFDPPPMETYSYISVDINRNVASFGLLTARDYKNSVNSADVSLLGVTLSKGDGYLADYTASPQTKDGVNYFKEHLSILISDRPLPAGIDTWMRWQQVLLDQGLYTYDAGTGIKARIQYEGVDAVKPARLDGSGGKLAETADPVWLPFTTKKTRAWSGLNLPATWFQP